MSFTDWDPPQIVILSDIHPQIPTWIPQNTLAIPLMIALCFAFTHLVYGAIFWARLLRKASRPSYDALSDEEDTLSDGEETLLARISARAHQLGGWKITSFMAVRLAGCLALLILSCLSLKYELRVHRFPELFAFKHLCRTPSFWIVITYLYSAILAVVSLSSNSWSISVTRYNIILLLSVFAVYAYRDLWPLATYTKQPQEASEGAILWLKICILAVTAIVVPLFIPRRYVPVDPKDPMPVANAEQTSSLFDRISYGYLNPVISAASRVCHLSAEDMPPMMDSDASKNLREYAFPLLDTYSGAKNRHITVGLLRVFWKQLIIMCASLGANSLSAFCSPIAIFHILQYLERGSGDDDIHPWFWIIVLAFGSVAGEVTFQSYVFHATRMQVHLESLLTQLIFEHSLRIRVTSGATMARTMRQSEEPQPPQDSPQTVVETEGADSQSSITVSSKGGGGKDAPKDASNETRDEDGNRRDNHIGKIMNLMTTDLTRIGAAKELTFLLVEMPLQTTFAVVFLYKTLGWSSLIGIAVTILFLPIPGYVAKLLHDIERKRMESADTRVQKVSEVLDVLRMIKLFGWEQKMMTEIEKVRNDELSVLFRYKILESLADIVNNLLPNITMVVTYAVFTLVMKQQLTPSIIFSTLTVFNMLRKVSLDRLNDFLKTTELLDIYSVPESPPPNGTLPTVSNDADEIGFRQVSFAWSAASLKDSSPATRRAFKLNIPNEVIFKSNSFNLVVGPTGSGKNSILMALLGEMHLMPAGPRSWCNLDRSRGVAYAAQESWVQNETIRKNILFGETYNEARYKKVLHQCALNKDLELFHAGDLTEVGEKGITLSGGQKARVTLARAIYSSAQVLLLDDILAALDAHTASWIVKCCFKSDLVRGRTVILVTHNVPLLLPISDLIISIGMDGSVRANPAGTVNVEDTSSPVAEHVLHSIQDTDVSGTTNQGKLILKEELVEGHVTWKSMKLFLSSHAGSHPFLFSALWLGCFMISDGLLLSQNWFLGFWGSQYETHDPSEVKVSYYLTLYASAILLTLVVEKTAFITYLFGSMRASKKINSLLIKSVLTSTFRWLDTTPIARIITRCTRDIEAVDGSIAERFLAVVQLTFSLATKLGAIILFAPLVFFPGLAIGAMGFYIGNLYLKAQLSAKREMSNARSPVLAHLNAAVSGIVSIRAYGAQEPFKTEASLRIDRYTHMSRIQSNLNRWVGARIDLLGTIYFAGLATYLIYGPRIGASDTGFILNAASDFSLMILLWVRFFNDFEVEANSLERIQGFIDIDHERSPIASGTPPATWPTSGDLHVKNLSARYSRGGPNILHNISFDVKSGERLAVVGRTGSGKSSLALALLRCIITDGDIVLDGKDTAKINLDDLRSRMTIIPQVPELLSGTLRKNLDPFDQHDDAVLNKALSSAGLFSLQEELEGTKLTLDADISSGGSNVSVGERQIIALARAFVRHSKILILDEATSAIDYKTDATIQRTLRQKLPTDVTVITIAHRLRTIMDSDRILVLDSGRIAECDKPSILLQREGSMFKALVDGSGDKDELYALNHRR
ncbi:hypothetical protein D9619_012892 [Psilocybe cf. subviscida]|uniref:P-loop containing nucleoside triphosphate hydrolase protein n=1 Tax=Psilocybe cf. subviscida TaxID=2480587 RepID=A0A8H5BI95_9AGAR|nr:hypothetical protein D9619_012892 [Psilocybe cf. subviscida]